MDEAVSPAPGEDATARALITTLQEQVRTLQRENAALRQQLDVLCQRMFGKRSARRHIGRDSRSVNRCFPHAGRGRQAERIEATPGHVGCARNYPVNL
jgi:hypothetical protein